MRICVAGVGAVGGYFGARLAVAGSEVAFLARGATLRALRDDGLRVDSPLGDLILRGLNASDDPASLGAADAVILGVKAWQVADVAARLRPLLADDTAVLPLQNGVEAAGQVAAAIGPGHVLGGTCRIVARTVAPAHVAHLGVEPSIALGELDNRASERVAALARELERAGIAVTLPADIHAAIWQKFLFIAAVSGVGAAARAPIGRLRGTPATRELLRDAMVEVARLAAATGVALADDIVERTLAFVDAMPADATASMQRDIAEGRPSELEAITGAVLRLGREAGLATPVHGALYAVLAPSEAAARKEPA